MSDPLLLAKTATGTDVFLLPQMANRHGLVAGATGTGKTVTLQALAESFSRAGVPVFAADVKGDLAGVSQAGGGNPKVDARLGELGLTAGWDTTPCPVMLWDVFGESGQPVRATVSEMGPLLLSRMLELNDVQEGVLNVAFRVADENGLLLLDLKDLRAMLAFVEKNAAEYQATYGNVSGASVGSIQRSLLILEEQGGDQFFGEPALNLGDLMRTDLTGRGYISLLSSNKLMQSPRVYATLLLWLLSELFEQLPEVGDLDKPKLVFFFDEAHLLFDDAPPSLMQKVEQVVRLIRSKGVGVYFVTQNPTDIPDDVLGQLGNKIQHALRAYTPKDLKAVTAMAETFRPNPTIDVATAVTELGVGEALISTLDASGAPMPVERAWIVPPHGHIGAPLPEQLAALKVVSPVASLYAVTVDRESAHEQLAARAQAALAAAAPPAPAGAPIAAAGYAPGAPQAPGAPPAPGGWTPPPTPGSTGGPPPTVLQQQAGKMPPAAGAALAGVAGGLLAAFGTSAVRSMGSAAGREITRGLLGGIGRKIGR